LIVGLNARCFRYSLTDIVPRIDRRIKFSQVGPMTLPTISWMPLERGQLAVMQINAALTGTFFLVFAMGLDLGVTREANLPPGLIVLPVALLLFHYLLVATPRRFRRWGYANSEQELHVSHGVLVHVETTVAFHRVQHIDIAQGPIERIFGVWQLVLNTAGTRDSRIRLPGLSHATAEALRDEIRQHIRAEAA
jgi:membrane protein YdbS with pleckstrin-like domain